MSELLTTFDNALKEFAVRAAYWHSLAADYKAGRRQARTTLPELRQWIETTRSLADRLPCGGEALRMSMISAADGLAAQFDWRDKYFLSWPSSVETYADANWRVNLNLWAAHEVMRGINQLNPDDVATYEAMTGETFKLRRIPPTKFWPAMFEALRERIDLPFADYEAAQKRVSSLDKTIKPEMRELLMLDLFADVHRNGHFQTAAPPPYSPDVLH